MMDWMLQLIYGKQEEKRAANSNAASRSYTLRVVHLIKTNGGRLYAIDQNKIYQNQFEN